MGPCSGKLGVNSEMATEAAEHKIARETVARGSILAAGGGICDDEKAGNGVGDEDDDEEVDFLSTLTATSSVLTVGEDCVVVLVVGVGDDTVMVVLAFFFLGSSDVGLEVSKKEAMVLPRLEADTVVPVLFRTLDANSQQSSRSVPNSCKAWTKGGTCCKAVVDTSLWGGGDFCKSARRTERAAASKAALAASNF
jgi:hypothetical protein